MQIFGRHAENGTVFGGATSHFETEVFDFKKVIT